MTRLLDVVMGYDCNLACDYCTITPLMRRRALTTGQIVRALRQARHDNIAHVSFTGGEPTTRPDLLPLVREAKRLGFESIKLQTNGLLLSDVNLSRLEDAGVTRFHVSIHTHLPADYEQMVQRPATFDAMQGGLQRLVERGLDPVVDMIMTDETAPRLGRAVDWWAALGVRRGRLWLVSLTDNNQNRVGSLLSFRSLLPFVFEAFEAAHAQNVELLSLHLPHCLLGKWQDHAVDPAAGGVRLLTPDDQRDLADAKLTPGHYVAACDGCPDKHECRGLRPDYLQEHGDRDVAEARGRPPTQLGRRHLPQEHTV